MARVSMRRGLVFVFLFLASLFFIFIVFVELSFLTRRTQLPCVPNISLSRHFDISKRDFKI